MVDCFSPTFPSFFFTEHKKSKKINFNFLLVEFTLFPSLQVFSSGIKMGVNIVSPWAQRSSHAPPKGSLGVVNIVHWTSPIRN